MVYEDTYWAIYTVNGNTYQIEKRTCATITGTWSDPVVCTTPSFGDSSAWHLDVIKVGSVLYSLMHAASPYALYFMVSTDMGATWTTGDNPLIAPSVSGGMP